MPSLLAFAKAAINEKEIGSMPRPHSDEHNGLYSTYIDQVPDRPILEVLAEAVHALEELLSGLAVEQEAWAYAEGKWSIREALCHVVDIERLFSYRALHIARSGSADLPGMDREVWVEASNASGRAVEDLLAEFRHLRASNCRLFGSFDETVLDRRGSVNGSEVTVRALIYFIAGHEIHHRRVFVERYLPTLGAAGA